MHFTDIPIILASSSIRRKEILEKADIDFQVIVREVDESHPSRLSAREIPEFLARKKAAAYSDLADDAIVITAYMLMSLEGKVIPIPKNDAELKSLLFNISGKSYDVMNSICLYYHGEMKIITEKTKVYMKDLNEEEIDYYIRKHHPIGKHMWFDIQGWLGLVGVSKIEGDFFNASGMPISRIIKAIKDTKKVERVLASRIQRRNVSMGN